jgi:hypothetical protein
MFKVFGFTVIGTKLYVRRVQIPPSPPNFSLTWQSVATFFLVYSQKLVSFESIVSC